MLIALLLLAAVIVVVLMVFQPFGSAQGDPVNVTITEGSSAREIGDQLAEAGVVSSGALFSLRATLAGKRADLRSGPHTLHKDMTYSAAIEALSKRPTVDATATIEVTIPEGLSRSEIAKLVGRRRTSAASYTTASKRFSGRLNPFRYGAPKGTRSTEGFLFPATYELKTGAPAKDLVDRQLKAFKDNFASVDLRRAKRKNLTAYDVLIIASMVEREAQLASERKLIAAVIYNRLKDGIPLQIDATSRYALNNWTRPAEAVRARQRLAVQHPQARRPAADADRQPRAGVDPRGRGAGERELPLLRRQARHLRQARVLVELREVRGRQPSATTTRATRPAASRRRRADEPRYGVLGWPVGHSRSPAMMQAAGLERYQRLPVAPEAFDDTVRALGASGFQGANVTIPHKEAALALATTASEAARAIGAANTLTFGDGRRDRRREHRRAGPARRPRRAHAAVGVRARRRRQRPRRRVGADAGRDRRLGLQPHPASARASSARGSSTAPVAAELLVNCTSLGLAPSSSAFKELPRLADVLGEYETVVDLVYRAGGTVLISEARSGAPASSTASRSSCDRAR